MITRYAGGRDKSAQNAAKQRYNAKAYDQVKFFVHKGGRAVLHALAANAGLSMSEYLRHCVIKDANERGIDVGNALGGGGSLTSSINSQDSRTDQLEGQCSFGV